MILGGGLNLSGATNVWELAALKDDATGVAGTDFDQIVLTGGALVLNDQSTLDLRLIDAATAPDAKGAIGITADGQVQGVDIQAPTYAWSETHYLPIGVVTPAYKATLYAIAAAPVNNATWRGFAAGEVLFKGASGQQRGEEDWAVTFKFEASPNATGLTVGDITGISKKRGETRDEKSECLIVCAGQRIDQEG